jgi:hypothetical protein
MYAEDILKVLSLQKFADFYGIPPVTDLSPFTKYLVGDDDAPTRDEILKKICQLFNVKRKKCRGGGRS